MMEPCSTRTASEQVRLVPMPASTTELLDSVGRVIDSHGGSFSMHYDAVLLTAVRL
jgi:hypothetical protein